MIVILDWDHTLFDTNYFKDDLAGALAIVGLKKRIFFLTYRGAVQQKNGHHDYDYLKHLKIIGQRHHLSSEKIFRLKQKFLKIMKNGSCYLFPETVKFLKILKKSGARLILCTLGNKELQRKKIYSSGVKKYFSLISITSGSKHKIVRNFMKPKEKTYFLSDDINELKKVAERFSFVKLILKKRPDKKEAEKEARRLRLASFTDLLRISRFLLEDSKK
jgi:FMN phosphatase YigB (HAD superfamily)